MEYFYSYSHTVRSSEQGEKWLGMMEKLVNIAKIKETLCNLRIPVSKRIMTTWTIFIACIDHVSSYVSINNNYYYIIIIIIISNSNWTKWSTIQGVIARVISKSDEREARGRFEITSTITL